MQVDPLGSPYQIRSLAGQVLWRWESEGYGGTAPNEDVDGDGRKLVFNPRFPGQYYDRESGLHYNGHRIYHPRLGRYISSDPIGVAGGINTYLYVGGNPISNIDPRGLDNPGMGPYGPLNGWRSPNTQRFVDALTDNAEASSVGLCARYVRRGLEAGGADTTGHPGSTKDWGPLLEKMGYYPISSADYEAQTGDVVEMSNSEFNPILTIL